MIYISHRGNIFGPDKENENKPHKIEKAIALGLNVEIDVWVNDGKIFLGHDKPETEVEIDWLKNRRDKLWVHCKNAESLDYFSRTNLNYFFHNADDYTMTSHGYVWAYPGKKPVGDWCIAVMPELAEVKQTLVPSTFWGVCSDYVFDMEKIQ